MRNIARQVEHLTQELRELRLQLEKTNTQPTGAGDYTRVLNQVLGADLVPDLTDLVNQLSQFLWLYIDSAGRSAKGVDFAVQSKRLEKATEMLRRLHFASSPILAENSGAFIARMTKTVDRLLESNPKPDVATSAVAAKPSGHGLVTIRMERTA